MNKKSTHSWLRHLVLGAAGLMALGAWGASITVDGINYTTSVDRVTKENVATVARYTINKTDHDTIYYEGDIVIPEFVSYGGVDYKVTATAANAFLDCRDLTSLVLPETCVTIGRSSFKNCISLTVSPIPNTASTIGTGALAGCTGLEEFTVPAAWNGPMVGDDLAGMSNLKRLIFPESPNTFIMNFDAYGKAAADRVADKSIEEITILRNVAARETDANNLQPFHNLTALRTLTLGGQFTTITATMFQGCTSLQQVNFMEGNLVNAIGNNAFKACASLLSFTFPAAVTTVEANVFNGCSAMTSVNFGNATTSIGDGAFQGCSALTAVEFPATLTSIGAQAFQS